MIKKIQEYLIENNLDAYIVFTNDDHGSEYVVDYFKARAFLSGFTGSAGTLLITRNKSYLWTDGRYFLQAEKQLEATNTVLMKMGEEGVPSIYQFIASLSRNPKVAFDYKLVTTLFVTTLLERIKGVEIYNEEDLIDKIWCKRPKMVKSKAYFISDKEAGESLESKMERLIAAILENNAKYALISSLDDLAWLFNLRGNDITHNPVNYAYALISKDKKIIYIDHEKLNKKCLARFNELNIDVKEYADIYNDIALIDDNVLFDITKTNYKLYSLIKKRVFINTFPTTAFKAIKNPTELKNIKKAHIIDGVAMVKFMHYLKNNVGKIAMTEISLSDKLEDFRKESKDFLDLSFDTICGYKENGAIIHYSATPLTNKEVLKESLLLVDSGAQYKYGTTDITRTFALGKLTKAEKRAFTMVLKSHIAMSSMIFPKGVCGYGIDMVAREPLFKEYLDYNHGTGHGVGYLLNVHEGPQRVTMRNVTKETLYPFAPGMITSNEPGLYKGGSFGIRHENLVVCVKKHENEFGKFYGFEPLTYVPFDLDGVDKKLLSAEEVKWLNLYHKECYKKLHNHLDKTLDKYLKKITRPI